MNDLLEVNIGDKWIGSTPTWIARRDGSWTLADPADMLSAAEVVRQIKDHPRARVLFLTLGMCGGGLVRESLEIVAALRRFSTEVGPVVAHVAGVIGSTGPLIAAAADFVVMDPGSRMLFHAANRGSEYSLDATRALVPWFAARCTATVEEVELWLSRGLPGSDAPVTIADAEAAIGNGLADAIGTLDQARDFAGELARGRPLPVTARGEALRRRTAPLLEVPARDQPAGSIATSDYAYTGTLGGSDETATTGARMRNNATPGGQPAIICSPPGLKVGSYVVSEAVVASLTALARSGTSTSDRAWYRGNNDPNTDNGRPDISNAFRIYLESQVAASGRFWFRYGVWPDNDTCNMDGLRYVKVRWFRYSGSGAPVEYRTYYWPLVDRRYEVPGTPTDALNVSMLSAFVDENVAQGFISGNNPRSLLLVSLHGPNTHSDEHWYYLNPVVAEGYAMNQQLQDNGTTCPLGTGGPGGGGGGGSGGGLCPAPEVGVLLANGSYRPAGLLQVGDRIWTIPGGPSNAKEPGVYEVIAVEAGRNSERLVLSLDDGARLVYSPQHMVMTPSGWCAVQNLRAWDRVLTIHGERRVASVLPAATGKVIRITTTASTYVTEGGVLNHNLKVQ